MFVYWNTPLPYYHLQVLEFYLYIVVDRFESSLASFLFGQISVCCDSLIFSNIHSASPQFEAGRYTYIPISSACINLFPRRILSKRYHHIPHQRLQSKSESTRIDKSDPSLSDTNHIPIGSLSSPCGTPIRVIDHPKSRSRSDTCRSKATATTLPGFD
ncbi:hypothetical protein PCASD_13543 [Puccinia coronata f. sp. avenae]|uniref:Uncharacterized protein n=1 Tax=Puccinia coronata f. sp. avenae TaxID=200324 RepID=A0A2N5TZZ9_9BASI|nr:hypothetical protein PCASD_16890 [Puccinia coronata f. sp. avenae]PLW31071.1 hypothetical protein PCASD_13543 [Puccinia coronata f. sp. avenae]